MTHEQPRRPFPQVVRQQPQPQQQEQHTPPSPPTIITARAFPGIIPSAHAHNVSWSEDGQCLFLTRKGVNIVTPHLATSLPPPPTLIDPELTLENPSAALNESRRRAALPTLGSDDEDPYGAGGEEPVEPTTLSAVGAGASGSKRAKARRPVAGEVRLWSTGVELDKDGRDDVYGWAEVGEESTSVLKEREVISRQAIWSPSGLSDLGGCLLVVLNSLMQVSVYAPRNDPYTKQWDEIADITAMTKLLLPRELAGEELSEQGMLELRTTGLQWSSHPVIDGMIGIDGSLLALSSRAGKLALWSYGPEKRFSRLALIDFRIKGGWITDMAWSDWKVGDGFCESHLAFSLTDGSVRLIGVRRGAHTDLDGRRGWTLDVSAPVILNRGDRRTINSIKWIDDVLVWTKAGTVHLFADEVNGNVAWSGLRTLRLERVGNWASANGLGPCIGIHLLNHDTLLVVLSSLTAHLITSFTTSPTLAHAHDSLKAALGMRDMFVDQLLSDSLIKVRWRTHPIDPVAWTAHTAGWEGLGSGIATWVTEPVSLHNLDSSTEGKRSMTFMMASLGGSIPVADRSVIQGLQSVLDTPPRLIHSAPGRILLPYLLHILSLPDPASVIPDLLGLLTQTTKVASSIDSSTQTGLQSGLWGSRDLDSLRLKLVLAQWGISAFPASADEFKRASEAIASRIHSSLVSVLVRWASILVRNTTRGLDRQFFSLLVKASRSSRPVDGMASGSGDSGSPERAGKVDELAGRVGSASHPLEGGTVAAADHEASEERCPACRTSVDSSGTCEKGHVWSRCSITQLLITHPHYRVCSICPSISLLPRGHLRPPLPVDQDGRDHDFARFLPVPADPDPARDPADAEGDTIVQLALESAGCCITCGGRWQRAV